VAGAIAVAVAAAVAWQLRDSHTEGPSPIFDAVLRKTPESEVRRKLQVASTTPMQVPVETVARLLGNGSLVTAPDTVPFCIWMAAHHLDAFVTALGKTISVGGDCDTNPAIVGGIVALSSGNKPVPDEWLMNREPAQF
jgi:ADP-ribosylglycohydrolase